MKDLGFGFANSVEVSFKLYRKEIERVIAKEKVIEVGKLLISQEEAIAKLGEPLLMRALTEEEVDNVIFLVLQDKEIRKAENWSHVKKMQLDCIKNTFYTHLAMSVPEDMNKLAGGITVVRGMKLFVFGEQKSGPTIGTVNIRIVELNSSCSNCEEKDCPERK